MSADASDQAAMPRYLFIVAANQAHLWDLWTRRFSGEPKVQVLLDRRQGERRRRRQNDGWERRRVDRRNQQGIDRQLRNSGYAIVGPISR